MGRRRSARTETVLPIGDATGPAGPMKGNVPVSAAAIDPPAMGALAGRRNVARTPAPHVTERIVRPVGGPRPGSRRSRRAKTVGGMPRRPREPAILVVPRAARAGGTRGTTADRRTASDVMLRATARTAMIVRGSVSRNCPTT
jgi:hypothetical protein